MSVTRNTLPELSHSQRKRAARVARRKQAFIRAKKARDERSREIWKRIEAAQRREPVQTLTPEAISRNDKKLREGYGDEDPLGSNIDLII